MDTLKWSFDGQGEWEAASSMADSDGECLSVYRIAVCDDGTFDVTGSDPELGLSRHTTLETLEAAKSACRQREAQIVAGAVIRTT